MKKSIFISLFLCCTVSAFSQRYSGTYFYIKVGQSLESVSKIVIVHFNRDGNCYLNSLYRDDVINKYKQGILEEYPVNENHTLKYDSEVSTYKYDVYSEKRKESTYGMPTLENPWGLYTQYIGGYWYRAFSSDMSEMIYWYTTKTSNEAHDKTYYKRINPSDLIPAKVEYDFL